MFKNLNSVVVQAHSFLGLSLWLKHTSETINSRNRSSLETILVWSKPRKTHREIILMNRLKVINVSWIFFHKTQQKILSATARWWNKNWDHRYWLRRSINLDWALLCLLYKRSSLNILTFHNNVNNLDWSTSVTSLFDDEDVITAKTSQYKTIDMTETTNWNCRNKKVCNFTNERWRWMAKVHRFSNF